MFLTVSNPSIQNKFQTSYPLAAYSRRGVLEEALYSTMAQLRGEGQVETNTQAKSQVHCLSYGLTYISAYLAFLQVAGHGHSWKQLFFERNLQDALEQ